MTQSGSTATIEVTADVREGTYGDKVAAIEPGGAEFIPLSERHGRPLNQLWTWTSPNLEFATIFVGIIGVWFFGQSFWMATLAVIIGSALGSVSMGFLAARGPLFGVPQMVLSRIGFGFLGNILPAGINSVVAGVGWFAVNSVSGAFALSALTHMSSKLALVIIVVLQIAVAFFGHNLVHTFERYAFPLLAVIFVVATIVISSKAHPSLTHQTGGIGGFIVTLGAAFGYAAGWNPFASDYTRYLPPTTNRRATGWWAALGVFVSCAILETVGAAAATITDSNKFGGNPTAGFTSHLPTWIADLTLLVVDEQLAAHIRQAQSAGTLTAVAAQTAQQQIQDAIAAVRAGHRPGPVPEIAKVFFGPVNIGYTADIDRYDPAALAARLPAG
ncbi:MAG TPA: cytosine permease, partial [Micromonosporaceae bacterium]